MATVTETVKRLQEVSQGYKVDLSWLEKMGEWGVKATPEKRGLTLKDINSGSYGDVPPVTDNLSTRPRGVVERPAAYRIGSYPIRTKADIWLDNVAMLYEEAVQRQWSSATDIPWETIEPLPDDIERAECMFATFLTEVEFIAGDVPGRWVAYTSPEYYEPRMFLVSQIMDEARHLDVFRKRALVNGGGLMQKLPVVAAVLNTIDSARDFSEMSARLHISGEGTVLTQFRMGELMAYNNAEKMIYRLCAQDEARHVAFGVMHLKYIGEAMPHRREEMHAYLDQGEIAFRGSNTSDQNPARNALTLEALSILLGGGKDKVDEGFKTLMAVRRRQGVEYVQRIIAAGFGERFANGRAAPELCAIAKQTHPQIMN